MARVIGLNKTKAGISRAEIIITNSFRTGLTDVADNILRAAKILTPVDKGILINTGHVSEGKINPKGNVVVEIIFGGGAAKDYAVRQHEDLTLRHKPGKSSKFLQKPAQEIAGGTHLEIIKREIRSK